MYKRVRDLSKCSDLGVHEFTDFAELMQCPLNQGLSTVKFGDREFDIFYEDRGAPVTFVAFTAAVNPSLPGYPVFSSRPVAARLNVNYLGIADPIAGGHEALTTFWYLGSANIPLATMIPRVIRKVMNDGSGEHILFFGSSAGGFAALNYSAQFEGSAVMVMNPRINLLGAPKHAPRYVPIAFPGVPVQDAVRALPYNQAAEYSKPRGNFVVYLQNLQDDTYRRSHYAHFEKAVHGRDDIHFVTGQWGPGHVVPPRHEFEGLLDKLVEVAPNWSHAIR